MAFKTFVVHFKFSELLGIKNFLQLARFLQYLRETFFMAFGVLILSVRILNRIIYSDSVLIYLNVSFRQFLNKFLARHFFFSKNIMPVVTNQKF